MKRLRVVLPLGSLLVGAILLAGNLAAGEWSRKTAVTLTAATEIPGVHQAGWGVLPPGRYVFTIKEAHAERHVLQISDEAETQIYATLLAMPNYRLRPMDQPVVTYVENTGGRPEPLRAFFYPGRNWGEEIVYPKARAAELAKSTKRAILFTTMDLAQPPGGRLGTLLHDFKIAPILAIKPTGEEVDTTEVVTTPPAQSEVQTAVDGGADASRAVFLPVNSEPAPPGEAIPLPVIAIFGALLLSALVASASFIKHLR